MDKTKTPTEQVAIHMDGATQTVTFSQRRNQFAVKPDVVTVPIAAIKAVFAQHLLAELQAAGIVQDATQAPNGKAPALAVVE